MSDTAEQDGPRNIVLGHNRVHSRQVSARVDYNGIMLVLAQVLIIVEVIVNGGVAVIKLDIKLAR